MSFVQFISVQIKSKSCQVYDFILCFIPNELIYILSMIYSNRSSMFENNRNTTFPLRWLECLIALIGVCLYIMCLNCLWYSITYSSWIACQAFPDEILSSTSYSSKCIFSDPIFLFIYLETNEWNTTFPVVSIEPNVTSWYLNY